MLQFPSALPDGMNRYRIDIFLAADGHGYVIAPAGAALAPELVRALGGLHHGWTQDVGAAATLPGWRAVRDDIDACGYSILAETDFARLLLAPRLQTPKVVPAARRTEAA
ncbi:hypothetical protein H0E84_02210 [Luteimonas sp. SJ-92]|uniref:Uncharacterized protein n=1 Tax=Luteimonas salinisoli TaxID=2752307 RepID=A0A853J8W8_9GAMM|nr:hypothetical protein [Luteimonas salinisoli]NZA25184.1 hypothetical protein [Luteimonas salinisoli]